MQDTSLPQDNSVKWHEADGEVRQYTERTPTTCAARKIGDKLVVAVTHAVVVTVYRQPAD